MDWCVTRGNVAEVLLSVVASAVMGLLVLVSGMVIDEAAARPDAMIVAAAPSSGVRFEAPDDGRLTPREYLCCALAYAEPELGQ